MDKIPFNKPYMTGRELYFIAEAQFNSCIAGDGPFTSKCSEWLQSRLGIKTALLTHSATGALEIVAMLLELGPGDEVIMPSFTSVSTATAFVREGATPVFVDIDPDTLNISPEAVANAVTNRTKAIVVVHYAGIACDMAAIRNIAAAKGIPIVEDAAQAILSRHDLGFLGAIGDMACFSFHETKNITCGEGGALLINNPKYIDRAEILREKGTNRKSFLQGVVDKYTWQDVGSSFVPGELAAAYLWAQLLEADSIIQNRKEAWDRYDRLFANLRKSGWVKGPSVPAYSTHNGCIYYLVLNEKIDRNKLFEGLGRVNINAISHYEPLHNSVGGRKFGRAAGNLSVTEKVSASLVRLPLYYGISEADQGRVFSVTNLLIENQARG